MDAVSAPVGPDATMPGDLPPESPLAMPVQTLAGGTLRDPGFPTRPPNMRWRRFAVIGSAVAVTLFAAYQIWWLLRGNGIDPLEGTLLLLFVLLFAWIVQAFVGAVAGFVLVLQKRPARLGIRPGEALPALATRTALLMPIYNEEPGRLMAGLQAMYESLAATGRLNHFDFFVLSDTRGRNCSSRSATRSPRCVPGWARRPACTTASATTTASARPATFPTGCAAGAVRIRSS